MSGFEVPGSLLALPEEPDDVCRLAEEFLRTWQLGVPEPSGVAADRLAEAEARLGLRLPAALRWFLLRFGSYHPVVGGQDPLVRPDRLAVVDEVLVFRHENQWCATWGVRVADLAQPDPPVVFRTEGLWQPYHDRLSLDLLEWVLGESVLGLEGRADNRELDDDALAAVRRLTPLPLRAQAFWAAEAAPSEWYAIPDVLVRVDTGAWLWAAGRTPEALQRLVRLLPGDWLVTDDVAG